MANRAQRLGFDTTSSLPWTDLGVVQDGSPLPEGAGMEDRCDGSGTKGRRHLFPEGSLIAEDSTQDLVKATSSWLIVNTGSRRIQRPKNLFDPLTHPVRPVHHALEAPCGKIPVPEKGLKLTEQKKVHYADIDFNLHANNARYMEWAMDCLETELVTTRTVASFRINFNTEARLSDTIDLYVAETTPLIRYVEGMKGGKSVFQAEVTFRES